MFLQEKSLSSAGTPQNFIFFLEQEAATRKGFLGLSFNAIM